MAISKLFPVAVIISITLETASLQSNLEPSPCQVLFSFSPETTPATKSICLGTLAKISSIVLADGRLLVSGLRPLIVFAVFLKTVPISNIARSLVPRDKLRPKVVSRPGIK
ncbi:unannotated protein [freshwater metagenome]|uniref:Unannotated protein n=1 Tax=freshwater metagenome TaxID=449393 RepID=A0A6J6G7N3_9ZZZZ